ncbi:MAG: ATP-binding protein [Tannerellaceae bacterium]|nr:ATP-binding protein [Tannerellaceae bacterium]
MEIKRDLPLIKTDQFIDVIKELTEAKHTSSTRMLIGETGCGKTYAIDRFLEAYPEGTFLVTCEESDRLSDLLRKIQTAMNTNFTGSQSYIKQQIEGHLSNLSDRGVLPMLIFDESEYLKQSGLLSIKTIYDYIRSTQSSIVMVGTPDLLNTLKKNLHKPGIPQFFRRFKAGIREIRSIDRTYKQFFKEIGIDKEVALYLRQIADNYGELADYLEPAIHAAKIKGVKLNIDFFNSITYLQNRQS